MQLIKERELKDFWDNGWCLGFISKDQITEQMQALPHNSLMLRFSDTLRGGISLGFCIDKKGRKTLKRFIINLVCHLSPFTVKDFEKLSLSQRIISHNLDNIQY